MKKILIILFTILNFSNSVHHFGEQIEITIPDENKNDWKDKETNIFSQSKEMATCTCDLTSHCDIYCCCDEKCSDDDIKEWKEKSLCLNNNKKWVEDYMCKNGEETFNYNKEKAGINIKDQIFNIMCIRYDRSSDMVNYYLEYDEERDRPKINTLQEEWIEKFIGSTTTTRRLQNEKLKYGQKIIGKNLMLYKTDSNGNCIKADFYFLIPFESSCNLDKIIEISQIIADEHQEYGDTSKQISEITYIIEYSSNGIQNIMAKVLHTIVNSKQIKFKVQWKNNDAKQVRKIPPGYLMGNPIKISIKDDSDNKDYTYNYGYYFHIYKLSTELGNECVKDTNDDKQNSIAPITILFKNDMFISCKCSGNPTETVIYKIYTKLKDESLKFYSAPNATDYIIITDKTNDKFESNLNNKNIKMNLIFLTTQKGKENSPYDIIQKGYIKMENEVSSEKKISLNVLFVDFSFSSIENSKNNITTNSIPLPEKLIEKMSE